MGFLLQQLERRSTLANPSQYLRDYFAGMFGIINSSGITVTENNVDSCIVFAACVDRISKTIATLPLDLYKRGEDNSRYKANKHSLHYLLHNAPNSDMTAYIWRKIQTQAYLKYGVCYSKISYDKTTGDILGLWPIPPQNVKPYRNAKTYKLEFEVWNNVKSKYTIIPDDEMFRIFFNTDDGVTPKSPVRTYAEAIGLSLAMEKFNSRFFGNGANMSGVLTHPGKIDPASESFKRLKSSWDEVYSGIENSHKTVILEEGMKYEKIGIPPGDAQLLETKGFQAEEIARIFDIPLDRIQLGSRSNTTYNNAEQEDLKFMKFTILPHTMNWQQAINRYLLSKSEEKKYFTEFNFDILLKADTDTRSKFYHQMLSDGVLNADEIRQKENMNPQENNTGKEYYIMSNMMPRQLADDFWKSKSLTGGDENADTETEG